MLIDWFTVAAQTFNFLILVWLMKRFLYRPILHAIDEREKRIAAELADADAKRADAQREHAEYQKKNSDFDQQRSELLSQATSDAKAERQRLMEAARSETDAFIAKWHATLKTEARNLHQAFARRTQQEVFAISRKALTDLADASLEQRMSETFIGRLHEISAPSKAALAEALRTTTDPAIVRSAFDLPDDQRQTIQQAINDTFAGEFRVRFETAPDIISGIELSANGQKSAWSLADYLTSLEEGVDELLSQKSTTDASAARDHVHAPSAVEHT